MNNAFAIMHTWPDVRNAEYEVLQRVITAGEAIGQGVAVIDNNGRVLWASLSLQLVVGAMLPRDAVRYVISLHFESPRVLDNYSYYALWQPIEFYYDFGYTGSLDKFSTHNDLLSCDSDLADAHALNLYSGFGREPLAPLNRLFHAPAGPYHEPNIKEDAKLFYIGINWERIGRPKGRFHDTLVSLDQQGLTTIYGPEKILGVAPWEGFRTYQGELPFDGRSVMRAINRAGICLALSSAQHRATGIMSNRLFEGFAGGGAVIATPNPFIEKHFRDCVYLVDDSRGEEVLGQMILEAVREIRDDREEATRRVLEGQRILREVCSLEHSLQTIADNHETRVAYFEERFLAEARVTVILVDDYGSAKLLRERIADFAAQRRSVIDLHLICDELTANQLQNDPAPGGAIRNLTLHAVRFMPRATRFDGFKKPSERSGPVVEGILQNCSTPFFAIVGVADIVFSDHYASLARALENEQKAMFAASGVILQTRGADDVSSRSLGALRFTELDTLLLVNGPQQRGRFLFRTSVYKPGATSLMSLLDGEEIRFFQLAALLEGELAQTGYASAVSDETIAIVPRAMAEPPAVQQQYIRDRHLRDPRWLDRQIRGAKLPEFVFAYAPGAPVRWQDFTLPAAARPKLTLDQMIPICTGGAGLEVLGAGFSAPEPEHVWLASERGIIEFRLDAIDPGSAANYEIVLLVFGRRSIVSGREQHCTVVLNGSIIAYVAVSDHVHEMRIAVPFHLLKAQSAYRLELIPDHSEPAQPHDGVTDQRHVSIALMGIGMFSERSEHVPKLEVGRLYGCGTEEVGAQALARGFYAPEPGLCWIAGVRGDIRFAVQGSASRPALLLELRVRSAIDGQEQKLSFSANGRHLASLALPDGHQRILLPLDRLGTLSYLHVGIGVRHAEVTRDGDGRIVDGRLLGCAIFQLGIVDAGSFPDLLSETETFITENGVDTP